MEWKQRMKQYTPQAIQFRRALHEHPELSGNEYQTTQQIRRELNRCEIPILDEFKLDTGLVAEIHGCAPGVEKTVAIRADMDALPVTEATGRPFASMCSGRMHACGHDGHMAMALAAAAWVDRVRSGDAEGVSAAELVRNVLFVFQPAEETTGGAQRVCASGVFERLRVDRIFGFHLWPDLPQGAIASRPGALLARSSETTVTFRGVSAHIAKWREGRDALGAAARFVVGAKWLARRLEQDEPCTVRFGHLVAGICRGGDKIVLRHGYPRQDCLRLVYLVIKLQFLQTCLYRGYGVAGIIYRETRRIAETFRIFPKKPDEYEMERSHLKFPGLPLPYHYGNPLLHFRSRLFRES